MSIACRPDYAVLISYSPSHMMRSRIHAPVILFLLAVGTLRASPSQKHPGPMAYVRTLAVMQPVLLTPADAPPPPPPAASDKPATNLWNRRRLAREEMTRLRSLSREL